MQSIFRYFNSLGFKLTLSYTFVTVIPLVAVEVLGFFLLWVLAQVGTVMPQAVSAGINEATTDLRRYFVTAPPDAAGVAEWLDKRVDLDVGNNAVIWVTDTQGNVLGTAPANFGPVPATEAASLMQAALAGETDPAKLFDFSANGNYVAVAPIRNPKGQVAGLLILTANLPGGTADIYQQFVTWMGRILIFVTILAAILGTGIGYLTVRGINKRVKGIAQNASAWGQGNFARLNDESTGDEIGQLAREMNQVARQLQAMLDAQQDLAALEERNRLARDLHDTVKQQVFATTMQLGAASALIDNDPQAAKTHLEEAQKLAHSARDELGVLIHELRPVALAGRSFAEALRDYAVDWSRQTKIVATTRVQGEGTLSPTVEQTLLRVAQEALANVARHSGASTVEIDLTYSADSVKLSLHDNGQGFDPATIQKGVGLDSMQERLKAIGGSLMVESQPGNGTTVTATAQKGRTG